jgi:hypothetical protein
MTNTFTSSPRPALSCTRQRDPPPPQKKKNQLRKRSTLASKEGQPRERGANLLDSIHGSNVIENFNRGREATVKAEDLVLYQPSQGEVVEDVGKVRPCRRACVPASPITPAYSVSDHLLKEADRSLACLFSKQNPMPHHDKEGNAVDNNTTADRWVKWHVVATSARSLRTF